MQQAPVHRDNKRLRNALRKKIASVFLCSSDFLVREIEDYLLPTLVYYYYLDNAKCNFVKYLEDLDFGDKNYRFIFSLLVTHARHLKNNCPLGDLHLGDSTKLLIGEKVVYKKYPDYEELLASMANMLYPDFREFFPKISKNTHRFERDFVKVNKEAKSTKDLKTFYLNLGRIIPFLIFLRAIDLNAENGLVHLPYPVFFDMETIFSGDFAEGFDCYNVKNSGLVKVDEKNDSCFLTGGLKERDSLLKPLICGTSIKPYIGWRTKSKNSYDNQPTFKGEFLEPIEYLSYIKEGYFYTVELILKMKSELERIVAQNDAYIRVVIRPTRMYRFLILKSCYPQIYLKNKREGFIKTSLEEYNLIYKFEKGKLLENEMNALLKLHVPVFYSSIKAENIFCPTGSQVGLWYKTPYEVWKNYSVGFTSSFFQTQWEIIRKSLV